MKKITLLGTPLSQSFAARMQNAAYKEMNEDLEYSYTECDNEQLPGNIERVKGDDFVGCAVTKPNKIKVLEYLDELDPLCAKIGSSNTVVKKEGKLIGYNTDALGFYQSIEPHIDVQGKNFFCIGAGGVARAIVAILLERGAKKVYVTDMYMDFANSLADTFENCEAVSTCEKVTECEGVINASGVGMGKSVGKSPVDPALLNASQFCIDACYNPAKTQFLLDAEEKGCKILNGLDMSLYQGAIQIELWTGKKAPVDRMRKELDDILSGK